jgi:hypothetical protein
LTIQKGFSLSYSDERYKEEGKIVVPSFQNGLVESAGRAHSGRVIKCQGLGLDSGNKEEHDLFWQF